MLSKKVIPLVKTNNVFEIQEISNYIKDFHSRLLPYFYIYNNTIYVETHNISRIDSSWAHLAHAFVDLDEPTQPKHHKIWMVHLIYDFGQVDTAYDIATYDQLTNEWDISVELTKLDTLNIPTRKLKGID